MRPGPKYVVQFQWETDLEHITPLQAGVEALRIMRSDEAYVDVIDCDTDQRWDVRFRDHELEAIEVRVCCWDKTQQKMVKQPIKKWDPILQEFVPVEEKDEK